MINFFQQNDVLDNNKKRFVLYEKIAERYEELDQDYSQFMKYLYWF